MKKNEILMIYGTEYKTMTKQLLEEADLKAVLPNKNGLVGIKPNLVSSSEASFGATTHPEIVAGIIEYLQEHGYSRIVMLEGSWVGDLTAQAMKVCGYDKISQEYKVPFWDMQKDRGVQTDCAGMSLKICSRAKELDYLINVPVLKGHCQTKITCALKNMKGLIPNSEKRRFHSMGLHKPIAHLNAGITQDFIVVDNICGDLDFEDGGNPVVMNRILAGRDPVLVDTYVCSVLHYEKRDVPYISLAEKLGVGDGNLSHLSVCLAGDIRGEAELPMSRKTVELQDAVEEVESCSACYGYLLPALDMLREEGLFDKLSEKICIGQGFRQKTGNLGIGNCTRRFTHSLEGCPPTEQQIYQFLKQYLQNK